MESWCIWCIKDRHTHKHTHTDTEADWILQKNTLWKEAGSKIKVKNLKLKLLTPECLTPNSPRKLISCWVVLFKNSDGSVSTRQTTGKTRELPKAFNTAKGWPDLIGGRRLEARESQLPSAYPLPGQPPLQDALLVAGGRRQHLPGCPHPGFQRCCPPALSVIVSIFWTLLSRCSYKALLEIARHLSVTRHRKHPSIRYKVHSSKGAGRGRHS